MIRLATAVAVAVATAAPIVAQDDNPARWLARAAQGETGRLFPAEVEAEGWIMWVARNRVERDGWPDDYRAVVRDGFHGHRLVDEPDPDLVALAWQVILAPLDADPTGGCLFVFSAEDLQAQGWSASGAVRTLWTTAKGREWGLFFFKEMPR